MAQEAAARHAAEDRRKLLLRLMGARLALSLVVLAVALTLVGVREGAEAAERGLYGTVAAAFLATALYALILRSARRLELLGAAQLATDVALLTSLVYFSGGKDSIFTFLHVPFVVFAARLFGRPGAYGATAAASLGYGLLLVALEVGWLPRIWPGPQSPTPWFTLWGLHTGAWLLVALLASKLSRELDRTGRELDRRRTALLRLQRLHARTVESLTSGLLTTDRTGRITSFNPEAVRITGIEAAEATGLDLEAVLRGARPLVDRAAQGKPRARMPFQRRSGEELHLGVSASVLRDADGGPGGHVVIFQDVTEVVAMEGELRRTERLAAVGELAAGMAHEVRNPLASISGAIQMLRAGLIDPLEPDAERARLMDIVVRETDRVDRLIGEFLRFARPAPPKLTAVELAPVVADVLEVLAASPASRIEIESDVPAGIGVMADKGQLRQLLWNLVLNGVQAMPDGGCLRVAARRVGEIPQGPMRADRNAGEEEGASRVEISVADAGVGIAPEVLERMFEPFFTTRPEGTGLGLATVHRIVESHRGTLRVESAPEEGTVFQISLPGSGGAR